MKKQVIIIACAVLQLYSACKRVEPVHKPTNLAIVKNEIEQYHESGRYAREVNEVVQKALSHFKKQQHEPGSCVIFDIDDTLLSNYPEMRELSFGFVPKLDNEWILKAIAEAVPHVKALYDYCKGCGYTIVLLSGRLEKQREATIKNLEKHGFTGFKRLILRDRDEEKLTAQIYKSHRRSTLAAEGLRIIGCIGDQESDLSGKNTGYKVKIPNYIYIIN